MAATLIRITRRDNRLLHEVNSASEVPNHRIDFAFIRKGLWPDILLPRPEYSHFRDIRIGAEKNAGQALLKRDRAVYDG